MSANPLPAAWIDKLFGHMSAMYGSKFADLWRDTDPLAVKALWAEKLGGFVDHPKAIKAALDSLDSKPWPPTLPEFLTLCREAANLAGTAYLALPVPELTEEQREASRERIGQIRNEFAKPGKAWAVKLRDQYMNGLRLEACQIALASNALGETWEDGKCSAKKVAE